MIIFYQIQDEQQYGPLAKFTAKQKRIHIWGSPLRIIFGFKECLGELLGTLIKI